MFRPFVRTVIVAACLFIVAGCNWSPPSLAVISSGPERGVVGQSLTHSARFNGDWRWGGAVRFSWGDGDTSAWSEYVADYYDSVTMTHVWADSGHFVVKAQVKDGNGRMSEWLGGLRLLIYDSSLVRWVAQVGMVGSTCPAVGPDGSVYIVSDRGLVALSPDGAQKWVHDAYVIDCAPVVADDGTVYLTGNAGLLAVNPDGTTKWARVLSSFLTLPALGPDGTIYAADCDTAVAVRPDGSLAWRASLPAYACATPVVGSDGTICYITHQVVVDDTEAVCALAPDGSRKWAVALSDPEWVSACASGEFCVTGSGTYADAQAIVKADGEILLPGSQGLIVVHPDRSVAHVSQPWDPAMSLVVDDYGDAIMSANSDYWNADSSAVVCLDSSLHEKWHLPVDSRFSSAPGCGTDGTVYVGTEGGYLYAVKGRPLAADAPWPKFGHDSRNTGCAAGR